MVDQPIDPLPLCCGPALISFSPVPMPPPCCRATTGRRPVAAPPPVTVPSSSLLASSLPLLPRHRPHRRIHHCHRPVMPQPPTTVGFCLPLSPLPRSSHPKLLPSAAHAEASRAVPSFFPSAGHEPITGRHRRSAAIAALLPVSSPLPSPPSDARRRPSHSPVPPQASTSCCSPSTMGAASASSRQPPLLLLHLNQPKLSPSSSSPCPPFTMAAGHPSSFSPEKPMAIFSSLPSKHHLAGLRHPMVHSQHHPFNEDESVSEMKSEDSHAKRSLRS